MKLVPAQARDVISFGAFSLVASERLLTKGGRPVELGSRAFDLLIALVSRVNDVVDKRDLLALVWPDTIVDEVSLRVHVAGLRKLLGEGKDGARYIATVPGRGYCFVAPVTRLAEAPGIPAAATPARPKASFLPARLERMVGRAEDVAQLSAQLRASRFVAIVGSGGVGKTTVAVAVAHDLLDHFLDGVLFADLGLLHAPELVPTAVASMLGISVQSADPVPSLLAYLRDKHFLLILDNCEHLIDAAASLATRIFLEAPQVHILATSREPLRAEGEHVHRLRPLPIPPDDPGLTAEFVKTFPATQLFLERAAANGARLDLRDADAGIVAHICRKLDGVALAIELAAGRVEAYGLQQTATLLDERLALLWMGQRTASPRQKTLQATLDWSYQLLSEPERTVLRRLAVFNGHFTLEAALAVVTSETIDQSFVLAGIDNLVAKSMIAARPGAHGMHYRLLETTRAFILDIRMDEAERAVLGAGHAIYFRQRLRDWGATWPALANAPGWPLLLADMNNVRAALEWCFGAQGDARIGVTLAAAAAPFFIAASLLTECHRWSGQAILALDEDSRGTSDEMHLQRALGLSSMFTRGSSEAARVALDRSLSLAGDMDDPASQLQALAILHMFHHRVADLDAALRYAKQASTVSQTLGDPAAMALARSKLGISLLLTGHLAEARLALEEALRFGASPAPGGAAYLGFDGQVMAGVGLAKALWWQGYPVKARERARQTVQEAASAGHPVALSVALIRSISILLGIGDLDSAEEYIGWFISRAESLAMGPYVAVGKGFQGELAIQRGDAKGGVGSLRASLKELEAAKHEVLTTEFRIALASGLAASGDWENGLVSIDETIRRIATNGDAAYMAEALRVRGRVLLSMPHPRDGEVEACLLKSLDCSRRQGALAWELRAAIDLAALWLDRGQSVKARALLKPVVERFTEGADTPDLKEAARVLAGLS